MQLKELLDQQTDLNKELVELRMTEPEARVGELTDAAEERRLRASTRAALLTRSEFTKQNDLYKDEIKELKKQVRDFEDAEKARLAEAKPAGAGADVGRLKAENESLRKQLKQAEKRVEPRSAPAVDRSVDGRGADARVEELEAQGAIVSSRDGVDRAVAQLRRELDTETAQSKVLQQRMQAQRTADQSGDETKLINELLADLTGLIVTSVVRNPSQGIHVTYHCVLADSRPRNKPGTVRLSASVLVDRADAPRSPLHAQLRQRTMPRLRAGARRAQRRGHHRAAEGDRRDLAQDDPLLAHVVTSVLPQAVRARRCRSR